MKFKEEPSERQANEGWWSKSVHFKSKADMHILLMEQWPCQNLMNGYSWPNYCVFHIIINNNKRTWSLYKFLFDNWEHYQAKAVYLVCDLMDVLICFLKEIEVISNYLSWVIIKIHEEPEVTIPFRKTVALTRLLQGSKDQQQTHLLYVGMLFWWVWYLLFLNFFQCSTCICNFGLKETFSWMCC